MARWKAKGPPPKTRFCWECSRQLYGRQFSEVLGADGNKHAVHKSCAKDPEAAEREAAERDFLKGCNNG
jgi:hypothetical protein